MEETSKFAPKPAASAGDPFLVDLALDLVVSRADSSRSLTVTAFLSPASSRHVSKSHLILAGERAHGKLSGRTQKCISGRVLKHCKATMRTSRSGLLGEKMEDQLDDYLLCLLRVPGYLAG